MCSIQCKAESQKGKFVFDNTGQIPWNKNKKLPYPIWNKNKKGLQVSPRKGKKYPYLQGANNPNWKGGITPMDKLERVRFRQTMQKLIFERDNYKCQICESTGDLQVDHIASWTEFKELRFDPENCRTLCAKCHYKLTFGREMPENVKAWGHNLGRRVIL